MNRHRAYWPLDDAPLKDGDGGFVGVDERLDPDILPPGMVASATNCRFRNGRVEPRAGVTILPWMKADGRTPFTTTGAMHVFKVSPPNAYAAYVGSGSGAFAPDGSNNAVIGIRFGELVALQQVRIYHDYLAPWAEGWGTYDWVAGVFAASAIINGVRANTSYVSNLGVSVQELQVAFGVDAPPAFNDELVNHCLRVDCVTSTGTLTGYLTYGPA